MMPIVGVDDAPTFAPSFQQPQQPPPDTPSWADTFHAAFHLGNDVTNFIDATSKPQFPVDVNYDLAGALKKRGLENDASTYYGVGSDAELNYMVSKVNERNAERDVYARSGWKGTIAGIAAGVVSPTMLIPMVGEARGVKAFFTSASLAALAGGAQEEVLRLNQPERTVGESITNIGMQTLLGGILGGTIKNLSRADVERISHDMYTQPGFVDISPPLPKTSEHITESAPAVEPKFPTTVRTSTTGTRIFEGPKSDLGVPTGELTVRDHPTTVEVLASRVQPEARGQGLGKDLYRSMIDDALQQGKTVVSAPVVSEDAARVYESLRKEGYDVQLNDQVDRRKGQLISEDSSQPVYQVLKKEAVERMVEQKIAEAAPKLQAAGAKAAYDEPGGLAVNPGALKGLNIAANQLARLSLPQRTLLQETSLSARSLMGRLAGNMGMERSGAKLGIAAAPGGSVGDRAYRWHYHDYLAINKIDEMYQQYRLGKHVPLVGNQVAALLGNFGEKLSKSEFRAEITRAIANGNEHVVPAVAQTADYIDKNVYQPIFDEAVKTGAIPKEALRILKANKGYVNYLWRPEVIDAYRPEFIDKLRAHFLTRLNAEFEKKYTRFIQRQSVNQQAIEDASLTPDAAIALRDQFIEKLKSLSQTDAEEKIAEAKAQLKSAKTPEAKAEAKARIKDLTSQGGKPLEELRQTRQELRRRINNLNKNAAVLGEKQAAKLDHINRLEDMNLNSLERASKKSQKVLNGLDAYSPREMARQLRDLKNEFAQVGAQYDRGEEQVVKMAGEPDLQRFVAAQEQQAARTGKLTDIANELGKVEDTNPELARLLIKEANLDILDKVNRLNNRRAMQMQKLAEEAKGLDPKLSEAFVERMKGLSKEQRAAFREAQVARGNEGDVIGGKPNFNAYATDVATEIAHKMTAQGNRLPFMDIAQGPRGPELVRALDVNYNDFEKFLENDIEKLTRAYVNTLGPDIEMMRAFGDVGAKAELAKVQDEFNAQSAALGARTDLNELQKSRAQVKLKEQYRLMDRALQATVARIRHNWGVPTDPRGFAYRAAKVVMQLNVLRYMGGVAISSLPDPGRLIMKQGLTSTFHAAFDAYTSGMKTLKIAKTDAQMAGEALDIVMHSRAYALAGLMQEVGRNSRFERGVEFASNKMGALALFDGWTATMKQFASAASNIQLMDAVDKFLHSTKEGEVKAATEHLANRNINGEYAQRIWDQVTAPNGGEQVNGRWYPQIENWTSPEGKQAGAAYLAALGSDIRNTIITPGLERPLWMDQNTIGKLLAQFRSFNFATTSKTIIAGLQKRDADVVTGVTISLAMGALSDYLYSVASGGETYKRWQDASAGQLADRAIARSGMRGVFDELSNVTDKIAVGRDPKTGETKTLSQELGLRFAPGRAGSRQGDDLPATIFGPSFDLLEKSAAVVAPGKFTKSTVHKLRQVLPFQNLFYLRQIFDAIEQASSQNLPGKSK